MTERESAFWQKLWRFRLFGQHLRGFSTKNIVIARKMGAQMNPGAALKLIMGLVCRKSKAVVFDGRMSPCPISRSLCLSKMYMKRNGLPIMRENLEKPIPMKLKGLFGASQCGRGKPRGQKRRYPPLCY
jgi:hypothetical protein